MARYKTYEKAHITKAKQHKKLKNNIMIIIKLYVVVLSIVLRFFRTYVIILRSYYYDFLYYLLCLYMSLLIFCVVSYRYIRNPAWIGCEFCHIISCSFFFRLVSYSQLLSLYLVIKHVRN